MRLHTHKLKGLTWRDWHNIIEANNRYQVDVRGSGRGWLLKFLLVEDVIRIILEPFNAFQPFLEILHRHGPESVGWMRRTLSRSALSSSVSGAGIRTSSCRGLFAAFSFTLPLASFCFPFFFFGFRPRSSSPVVGAGTTFLGGGIIQLSKSNPSGTGTFAWAAGATGFNGYADTKG